MSLNLTRRQFMAGTAATAALSSSLAADAAGRKGPCVVVFSKHLQHLGYGELAKTCKQLGLDGVDLTVRDGGHVEPAKAAADLPRAVEAIRAEGLEVPMITTRLASAADPEARPTLEAASKQGIRFFRIGGQKYSEQGDPCAQLPKFAEELRGLAELAAEYDMVGGYHNHSGYRNVGAPLWDLKQLFDMIGSDHIGSNFDVGHAKVEGAYGAWQTNIRMIAPYVKMMAVKDFKWFRDKPGWVPLGEGIVPVVEMLELLRTQVSFNGPISLHFEYRSKDVVKEIREAVVTLRAMLEKAGY